MKNYILFSLFGFLATAALRGQSDVVNIPLDDPAGAKKLKLNIFQGSVEILGKDRGDVLVEYKVVGSEEEDELTSTETEGLRKVSGSNLELEMSSEDNIVHIESQNWNKNIHFSIEVPRDIQISIQKNIGGKVSIADVKGNLNIENNVGDVEVKNAHGIVNASANAGNITCHFTEIPEPKNMLFTSMTGKIDLSFPPQFAANLKLKTDMGDIYSDLDFTMENRVQGPESESKDGKFRYFHSDFTYAILQGGGPEITVRSKMGNIYLRESK